MSPQYVAIQGFSRRNVAALRSHAQMMPRFGCNLDKVPAIIGAGCNFAIHHMRSKPAAAQRCAGFNFSDRRQKCPRASNCSLWLACWLPLLPARSKKKNLSSLIQLRFRKSQSTPANTNNKNWGPALRSVPNHPRSAGRKALPC